MFKSNVILQVLPYRKENLWRDSHINSTFPTVKTNAELWDVLGFMKSFLLFCWVWSEFQELGCMVSGACWGPLTLAGESHLCTSLPKFVFSDDILVAWNGSWWEYVHNRNGQMLALRIICPWRAGCETFTCTWLIIDQTKIDHELKSESKWLKFFGRDMGIANHFVPINRLCWGLGFFPLLLVRV